MQWSMAVCFDMLADNALPCQRLANAKQLHVRDDSSVIYITLAFTVVCKVHVTLSYLQRRSQAVKDSFCHVIQSHPQVSALTACHNRLAATSLHDGLASSSARMWAMPYICP